MQVGYTLHRKCSVKVLAEALQVGMENIIRIYPCRVKSLLLLGWKGPQVVNFNYLPLGLPETGCQKRGSALVSVIHRSTS